MTAMPGVFCGMARLAAVFAGQDRPAGQRRRYKRSGVAVRTGRGIASSLRSSQ
jgi:hypothetical protein